MKKAFRIFILLLIGSCYLINAQSFPSIDKTKLKHPYIYFDDKEKQEILDYIKNDKEGARIFENLKLQGEILVEKKVDMEVFKLGNDFPNADRYRTIRAAKSDAVLLAFLYRITGDMRFARKAAELAHAQSLVPRWSNPYTEFDVVYERIWPYNVKDEQVSFSIDLDVSNTAASLAVVYDWLYPVLTKKEKDRIRGALLEKAILPLKGNYDYHWWATAYKCNWASVCNANIGIAVLSILTENPELEPMVKEAYERTSKTLDNCGVEGGWQEGYSYLNYAVRIAMLFADPLKRATEGKVNLYNHSTIREGLVNCAINSMVPPRYVINFADCSLNEPGVIFMMNKIANETGNAKAVWFRQNRLGKAGGYMDLIWRESKIKPEAPTHTSHLFKTTGVAVLRNDFLDENKPLISCKAGTNDDPHHGHLDVGSFNIWWKGEGYVAELGGMGYDEYYFTDQRWVNPFASSMGHQTIVVNGEVQIPAKLKDQPWKEGIGGEVVKFESGKQRDYILLDPTNAYPKKELKKWRRHIIFEKPEISIILDEIAAKPNSNIDILFNTKVKPENKNDHVLLKGNSGKMVLFNVSKTPSKLESKEQIVFVHPRGHARANSQIAEFPYITTSLNSKENVSSVFTIVVPCENEELVSKMIEAAKIVDLDTNTIELRFTYEGKEYKYGFKQTQEGLAFVNN